MKMLTAPRAPHTVRLSRPGMIHPIFVTLMVVLWLSVFGYPLALAAIRRRGRRAHAPDGELPLHRPEGLRVVSRVLGQATEAGRARCRREHQDSGKRDR